MKIAVITDDGQTISQHFGRAQQYLVFTVEDGQITARELRSKLGHQQFAQEEAHDHDHHDHNHVHGVGPSSDQKHSRMIEAIIDCTALLVRGMGRGAYMAVEQANITPVVTDIASAEEAVMAYINGGIVNHTEKLH